jgi:hypothetical protein
MKHSRSSAEVEIREAVVKRFRELWPDARIIHEMNVEHGSSRADVVAVQPDRLWICEIKSEKDTLTRLASQLADFGPACHSLIVAVHEKWTVRGSIEVPLRVLPSGRTRGGYTQSTPSEIEKASTYAPRFEQWVYPEPVRTYGRDWGMPVSYRVPWHHKMLRLLWSDELRAVAADHRVAHTSRTPGSKLAPDLCRLLTGEQIERSVCKYLRARSFAEADPPILIAKRDFPAHPASVRQEALL